MTIRCRLTLLCSAALMLLAVQFVMASTTHSDQLRIATLNADGTQASSVLLSTKGVVEKGALDSQLKTPLGSIWKLFVYAYAVDQQMVDPGYVCTGNNTEEIYCCSKKGERIDRDTALARSCGLYFLPSHLGIDAQKWRNYWLTKRFPEPLFNLTNVQPATEVPVINLLQSLKYLPAQQQAKDALLDVLTNAQSDDLLATLGGRFRVKTWSWHENKNPKELVGGFAGWLPDGAPIWAGGKGTSHEILAKYGSAIDHLFPITTAFTQTENCVKVALFSRYEISAITNPKKQPAIQGELRGSYNVLFSNGNLIEIESQGDMVYSHINGKKYIQLQVSRDEYVARVLDREASAEPPQAARAIAITARTYLLQNAAHDGDCLVIDDASATQRVSPRAGSEKAREIAAWTSDIILSGGPVAYHLDTAAVNRLVWQEAVAQANQGVRFDHILHAAFPHYNLASWKKQAVTCDAMIDAETWLRQQLPRWRTRLNDEPGYVETMNFSMCRLQAGNTHVDKNTRRIFVRGLFSQQERLDIIHEYLHLGFEHFPSGLDENYIEQLARRLL